MERSLKGSSSEARSRSRIRGMRTPDGSPVRASPPQSPPKTCSLDISDSLATEASPGQDER
eukprot:14517645-Alexandrium_andersonii.AAC.1